MTHSQHEGSAKETLAKLSEHLADKKNLFLLSNMVQFLALVVDSLVAQSGGIKTLMAECCRLSTAKKKHTAVQEVYA